MASRDSAPTVLIEAAAETHMCQKTFEAVDWHREVLPTQSQSLFLESLIRQAVGDQKEFLISIYPY